MVLELLITSYIGVFLLVFAINVVPFLMPPTWMVLATLSFLFPQQFSLLPLIFVGAFASTLGRIVLSHVGTLSRRLMSDERKQSMDAAGNALKSKKYGGLILTFLFALTPLPSNAYFLTLGTMNCNYFSVYAGFWLGRLISYGVTTMAAATVLTSLTAVFTSQIQAIIFLDILGVISMIVFLFIDWNKLLHEKSIKFIKPRFRKQ